MNASPQDASPLNPGPRRPADQRRPERWAPIALTLANGLCGLAAILALLLPTVAGAPASPWPVIPGLLLVAAACDAFDGRLARRWKSDSMAGARLDAAADLVSFGLCPGVWLWTLGLGTADIVAAALMMLGGPAHALAVAIRLRSFLQREAQRRRAGLPALPPRQGLPAPLAGLILAGALTLIPAAPPDGVPMPAAAGVAALVALLATAMLLPRGVFRPAADT